MVNNGCIVKSINLVSLFKIVEAREFELGVSGMLIGIGLGILVIYHKEMKPSYSVRIKLMTETVLDYAILLELVSINYCKLHSGSRLCVFTFTLFIIAVTI